MSSTVTTVKLSVRFYVFSILSGTLIGLIAGLTLASFISKEMARSKVKMDAGSTSAADYTQYLKESREAQDKAFGTVAPITIIISVALFSGGFFLVGRRKVPARFDREGVEAWGWFGTDRHLWTNFSEETILRARTFGIVAAEFHQFHFTSGIVSVNVNRIQNGKNILERFQDITSRRG